MSRFQPEAQRFGVNAEFQATFSKRHKSHEGCSSATRKFRHGQRIQSWMVHRSLHGRSCSLYLGQTHTLTVARLEDMAAAVLARLTGL